MEQALNPKVLLYYEALELVKKKDGYFDLSKDEQDKMVWTLYREMLEKQEEK